MNKPLLSAGTLRQRVVYGMNTRGFGAKMQSHYIRMVSRFAVFLSRSPTLRQLRTVAGSSCICRRLA